jgi:signal peptidase I
MPTTQTAVESERIDGPATTQAGTESDAPKSDSIRDTIESIIVAFILAFVFRAFVVEAFVIPTGSMAPGLYGKHGEYRCSVCEYPFAYSIQDSARIDVDRINPGTLEFSGGFTVICPNCGWVDLRMDHRLSGANVVPSSGDRILVLKWPYDIGGPTLGPKRWDVVVFKNPEDGETNFIKRLLGLPGEVLELIDGDAYAAPLSAVDSDIQEALRRPPKPESQGGRRTDRRLTPEQSERLAKVLRIQRKTSVAQESLWMLHYDHDYPPAPGHTHPKFDPPRWTPDPADKAGATVWNASTPCIRCTPSEADTAEHRLLLAGRPIRDIYGYNNVRMAQAWPEDVPGRNVGDVRLRFVLTSEGGDGHVALSLSKGGDEFVATISADGSVRLEKPEKGGIRISMAQPAHVAPLVAGGSRVIEYENLDYRVALRVDGVEVVATTDAVYSPKPVELLRREGREEVPAPAKVSIAVAGLKLELRHVAVHRDVYYLPTTLESQNMVTKEPNPLAGYPAWGVAGNPILLRDSPIDYFCCGDNSPQSKDSRLWWEACPNLSCRTGDNSYQLGTVPGDQMIGRAFFVYWPGGLRLSKDLPAVVPNVGRMRIIR